MATATPVSPVKTKRKRRRVVWGVLFIFAASLAAAAWMLDRMRLLELDVWWSEYSVGLPVVGDSMRTYQLGQLREEEFEERLARLAAAEAELEEERLRLEAEWAEIETIRAQIAAGVRELEQARRDLEAMQQGVASELARRQDEERLFEVYGAMRPDDAAEIVRHFSDERLIRLLDFLPDRQAAALLARLEPERVARLNEYLNPLENPLDSAD